MHKRFPAHKPHAAFTIVELLIVIVVIGILAAITIVAYNGIQQRARTAAATSALSQAKKKLELYKVDSPNNTYPTTNNLSDAGIVSTSSASFEYTSPDGATYCLTATSSTISYYLSSTTTPTPTPGGCPGHGQGGVAAVTNLATGGWSGGEYGVYWGVGGAGSNGVYSDPDLGRSIWRNRWTKASTANGGAYWQSQPVIVPGQRYQLSQTIRSSRNQTLSVLIVWVNAAANAETGSVSISGTNFVAGVPQRVGGSAIAPPGTGRMRIIAYSNAAPWSVGDTLDSWDTMLVQSDNTNLFNYADGSSPNWVWNGTAHASTSTGPPL